MNEVLAHEIEREMKILEKEKEIEDLRKKELLKEIIKATTYEKGVVVKEVFKLPMPTSKKFLDSKNVDIKTYGALMLESNWGGKFLNPHDRYIYADKFKEVCKNIQEEFKISESTLKRHINKLKKCDIKAIEPFKTIKGDLVYKLNYGVITSESSEDFRYAKYVTITNVALKELVNAYSENTLRIYLYMLYRCYKKNNIYIRQSEICEAVGLKTTSRAIVTDCVNALVKGGYITVDIEYGVSQNINDNGDNFDYVIPNLFYSLSDKYLQKLC